MDTKTEITIRAKKLGVLIRDARLSARRSVQDCAKALGVRTSQFKAYEEGVRSPSLPELEALVFYERAGRDVHLSSPAPASVPPGYHKILGAVKESNRPHDLGGRWAVREVEEG